MGVLTRKQGEFYVITSDRCSTDNPTQTAPKPRIVDRYEVWTGEKWTALMTDAMTFASIDEADEYVRINFEKVTGVVSPPKRPSIKRPRPPRNPEEPSPRPSPGVPGEGE